MFTKFRSYGKTLLPSFNRFFSTPATQSSTIYRPRRALMYVPGSNPKMLGKAPTLHADTICMDLEDAVSINQKAQARNNVTSTLQSWQQSNPDARERSERVVRINAVGTGYEQDDVAALLDAPVLPDGIVLPKVNHPDHVTWLHQEIDKRTKGREGDQKLVIIALIESAKALLSLQSIASCSNRLVGFIFGGDDFAADIGATRTKDSSELLYARQHMVMVGKAYGLQCIDIVNIQFQNLEFLQQECEEGYHFGFTGKQVIHPKQIDVVHKCFAPNPDKVQWAQRVVEESHKFAGQGVGAFTLDGHMIDMPTVKQAENVLIRARACGLI